MSEIINAGWAGQQSNTPSTIMVSLTRDPGMI
jgi:hypothetical protein